jgi:PPOX class probable F420-dependent enzyme
MQLTNEQRAFLDQPHFAVVATIGLDGLPHQTVMWYVRDGDDLVLSTPEGSLKHHHLRRDSRLSVCIEDGFRYLTLSGLAAIDQLDPGAARALYQQIGARYMGTAPPLPTDRPIDPKVAALLSRPRVTLRLTVDHIHSNGFYS